MLRAANKEKSEAFGKNSKIGKRDKVKENKSRKMSLRGKWSERANRGKRTTICSSA